MLLLVMMSSPVGAQTVAPADREAIRTVVQQQLDAFCHDNAELAFSFASPAIQEKFGTPEAFMKMVKTAYAPVHRPRHIVFKELRVIGGTAGHRRRASLAVSADQTDALAALDL